MSDWTLGEFEAANNADWYTTITLGNTTDTWTLANCTVAAQLCFPGSDPALDLSPYISFGSTRTITVDVPVSAMQALPSGNYPFDILVTGLSDGSRRRRFVGSVDVDDGITDATYVGNGPPVTTGFLLPIANVAGLQADLDAKQPTDPTLTFLAALSPDISSVAGLKTALSLDQVDNTHDASKPVSTAQNAAIAVAVATLVNSSPSSLDTLKELADAIGDDPNFRTTILNAIAARAASGANSDITSLAGLTTPLSVLQGGTGTTTGTATPPQTSVRQTVATGPFASGRPSFLPSSASGLSITAIGLSSSVPLIVTAALGFNAAGPVNNTYVLTANPTWGSLAASSTNYLYVNAATGSTGSTTLAPIYQYGGTASITSGQFTFDYQAMIGYMGNGSSSVATPLVFVGECITSASAVTNSVSYNYNGYFDSGYTNTVSSNVSFNHNIGCIPEITKYVLKNITTDMNYSPGQVIVNGASTASGGYGVIAVYVTPKTIGIGGLVNVEIPNATSGAVAAITLANWAYKFVASRGW